MNCRLRTDIAQRRPVCFVGNTSEGQEKEQSSASLASLFGGEIVLGADGWSEEEGRWLMHHCLAVRAETEACRADVSGMVVSDGRMFALAKSTVTRWYARSALPPLDPENISALDLLLFGERFAEKTVTIANCQLASDDGSYFCISFPERKFLGGVELKFAALDAGDKERITRDCSIDRDGAGNCLVSVKGRLKPVRDGVRLLDASLSWQQ